MATASTSSVMAQVEPVEEVNSNMSINSNQSEVANLSTSIDLVQSANVTLNTSLDSIQCEETNQNMSIDSNQSDVTHSNASIELCQRNVSTSTMVPIELTAPKSTTDIGYFIKRKCTDEEKYGFIKHQWIPDEKFSFPTSEYRNLKFQRKWLIEFAWLSYSVKDDGAYCRFCVFFFAMKKLVEEIMSK